MGGKWAVSGGGISGLTPNTLPKALTATTIGDSHITDDGTIIVVGNGTTLSLSDVTGNANMGVSGTGTISLDSRGNSTTIGDTNSAGNGTMLTVDDTSSQVVIAGGAGLTMSGQLDTNGQDLINIGNIIPLSATFPTIGTAPLPYGSIILGSAANHSVQLTGTFTANSVATFQDKTQTIVGRTSSVALTTQAASIGSTAIQVNGGVAPAGLYRLSYYLVTTTAGTSGTVSATFGWSDLAAARTSVSATDTFGSLAGPVSGTVIIQADGVANITYLTTVTAAVGNPRYALNITLEALQ